MIVPLGDFKATDKQRKIVEEIINSGMITEGKYTKLFEAEWAKYIGVKHCIACTNGTAALILVLEAMRYNADKPMRFLVPATTFPATLNAVLLTGHEAV